MSQKDSNKEEYISLTEATKYCDYSQEYLSLRARQGKLKAEKLGRNWVTTEKWVKEYFGKTNSSQARVQEKKANGSSFSINAYFPSVEERIEESEKIIGKSKTIFSKPELRYAVAGVLVFIFLGAGFMHACPTFSLAMVSEYTQWLNQTFVPEPIYTVKENVALGAASISDAGKSFYDKYVAVNDWVEDKIQRVATIPEKLSNIFFGVINLADKGEEEQEQDEQIVKRDIEFGQEQVDILEENIISDVQERFKEFRSETEIKEEYQGAIIMPLEPGQNAEQEIAKLKNKFSDEVEIQPEDENSGIITPIFREKKGDEYLYLMVPIKE